MLQSLRNMIPYLAIQAVTRFIIDGALDDRRGLVLSVMSLMGSKRISAIAHNMMGINDTLILTAIQAVALIVSTEWSSGTLKFDHNLLLKILQTVGAVVLLHKSMSSGQNNQLYLDGVMLAISKNDPIYALVTISVTVVYDKVLMRILSK